MCRKYIYRCSINLVPLKKNVAKYSNTVFRPGDLGDRKSHLVQIRVSLCLRHCYIFFFFVFLHYGHKKHTESLEATRTQS